jgi:class 3 adenylate cyclase
MQYLVPHFVLEKFTYGETNGYFQAVSLFVDVSGFSAVTTQLAQHGNEAAEVMGEIMHRIFEPLVNAIYEHGGFITTFAGDAFTALFPLEDATPHEEVYGRALAAALSIQAVMRDTPTQTTPYGSFPFAVKLGIGTGGVEWGILEPSAEAYEVGVKAAWYFNGPAIDSASSAEHFAQSGNIILTPQVYQYLAAQVQTLPAGKEGHMRLLAVEMPLPTPQPAPDPPDLSQTAFIPDVVFTNYLPIGAFRQVITVFVNLMGIDSTQQLTNFMTSVFSLQTQYGGLLARVDFGDKGANLLLFWGIPLAYENDMQRALSFLLALPTITDGSFKAGVTYQTLYVGVAGAQRRAEFTAYGTGINLAARLMIKAPWGEIWLDEPTARRARRHFVVETVGAYEFKGFNDPLAVFSLRSALQQAAPQFYTGEMIGRQAEVDQLRRFVQPILHPDHAQCAGICLIEGETGTGKSRLLYEFERQMQAEFSQNGQTVFWVHTYCDAIRREPLHPFRNALRAYFGLSPAQSDDVNKRAFSRKLDELLNETPDKTIASELNRLRSFLGALLGLYWENSLYTEVDPETRWEFSKTALKLYMQAQCTRHPVIVLAEDVHWTDPESRDFMQRWLTNFHHYPLAIIATTRPTPNFEQEVGLMSLLGQINLEKIDLGPLSSPQLAHLAEDVLGDVVRPEVVDVLVKHAEGNPFFAEQILLYMREQKTLRWFDGVWHLAQDAAEMPLPVDLRALFVARLDQLATEIREIVETAAVLGREFDTAVLNEMFTNDPELLTKLSAAEAESIWSAINQARYIFKNALLRDAAYTTQLRARRRDLHVLAAQALEYLYSENLDMSLEQLAWHYETACLLGLTEYQGQAVHYLQLAAEHARRNYHNQSALALYSRALTLVPTDQPETTQTRYTLLVARAEVLRLLFRYEEEATDLADLTQLAEQSQLPAQQAEVQLLLTTHLLATQAYENALRHAEHAVTLAQSAQHIALEAEAWACIAEICGHLGDFATRRQATDHGLQLARVAGRRDIEAKVLQILAEQVMHESMDEAQSLALNQEALAIYRQLGDRRREGRLLIKIGQQTRNPALEVEAMTIFREVGDRQSEAAQLLRLGQQALYGLDYDAIWRNFEAAHLVYKEIGDWEGIITAKYMLAEACADFGLFEPTLQYLIQVLEQYQFMGLKYYQVSVLESLTRLYMAWGKPAMAAQYSSQAVRLAREQHSILSQYLMLHLHMWVCLGLHDLTQATQYYEMAQALEAQLDLSDGPASERVVFMSSIWQAAWHLAQDNPQQALRAIERANPNLNIQPAFRMDREAWHIIDQVLALNHDKRRGVLLAQYYAALHEAASYIPDESVQKAFLYRRPANRDLLTAYEKAHNLPLTVPPLEEFVPFIESLPDKAEEGFAPSPADSSSTEATSGQALALTTSAETGPVTIQIQADHPFAVQGQNAPTAPNQAHITVQGAGEQPAIVYITINNYGTIHNVSVYGAETKPPPQNA